MKFEVEKKSHKKGWIVALSTILILGIVLVVKNSFAKYYNIKTIHLVNSTVNYTKGDFSIVAMYKNDGGEDTEITTMPDSGYTINQSKSYCTLNGSKDNNAKLSTDAEGNHEIKGLSKGSKCYIYFDKVRYLNKETILANQGGNKGKYNDTDSFTGIATAEDTGIYETEDDYGTSYYFRGLNDSLNNWVQFAGFYWRIIRINGNGSIRMIYSGVAAGLPSDANKTGEITQIGISKYNSSVYDNAYIGYMYGTAGSSSYAETHTNTNNSTIKLTLDRWFGSNLASYVSKLDTETGFCNDREIDKSAHSSYQGDGHSTHATGYAPWGRVYTNGSYKSSQTPSLKCTNKDRDLFTISSSKVGNKKLTYPVGLITSDEVIYAGTYGQANNSTHYLYTNEKYWTMSPHYINNEGRAHMFLVYDKGCLNPDYVTYEFGVRPVINLLPTTVKSGDGSESSPYLT